MERPQHLREWQFYLDTIYDNRNIRRSLEEIWLHLVGRAGLLAEALRRENLDEIGRNLALIFAWLYAFCNKLETLLDYQVWKRYNGCCPHCGKEADCICIVSLPDSASYKVNPDSVEPKMLVEWQDMFRRLYGKVKGDTAIFQIGFHLFEEVGEVSRALVMQNRGEVEGEIADVFAWMIGLANRLEIDLDPIIWDHFHLGCPFCHKEVCECV